MKSQLRLVSITPRACLAAFLFSALPMAACDHSNSVGMIGDASAGGIASGGGTGTVSAGGGAAAGAAGTAAGGTTVATVGGTSGAAGEGGGTASGQAGTSGGVSGGGKAGAAGSSAMDAGVDRYQCPLTDIYCPDGTTTDAYGCTICAVVGTGGGGGGGTTAKGGAGGTRADAAADAHQCPSQYINCTNYTYDAYGCKVCDFFGTGGSSGGTSGTGGTGGGGGGTSGAAGSGGTSGKVCQRMTKNDATCRSLNLPPQAYFCQVPASPASTACVAYDGIDSGDAYCCPEPYLACPDSPPTNSTACTGSTACSYGSHPDPTCRTSASCKNGTWRVFAPPSRCSEPQLPATCPAAPASGTACSSHGLNCYYTNGSFCLCTNCSIEEPAGMCGTTDTWRCWTPPGSDCPTYYPNLGTTCTLPANTSCQYTCAARTTCSAAGMWVDPGNMCPN